MFYLICFIAYIPLVYYTSVWIHEMGHVVFGRLAGYRSTAVGTGFGRLLLRWRVGSLVFFIRKGGGGLTYPYSRSIYANRRQQILMNSGGIIANLLAFALFGSIALALKSTSVWLLALAIYNLFVAACSLYPYSFHSKGTTYFSDGMTLRKIIKSSARQDKDVYDLNSYRLLIRDLEEIDDREMIFVLLVHSMSACHLLLNDTEGAQECLDRAAKLCNEANVWEKASLMGAIAQFRLFDDPAAAEANAREAERLFLSAGYGAPALLTQGTQISACLGQEEIEKSAALLSELQSSEIFRKQSEMVDHGLRLEAALLMAQGKIDEAKIIVEDLQARKSGDASTCGQIADALKANGRITEASRFYQYALDTLRNLFTQQSDPGDRGRFAARYREVLEQVAAHFRENGDEDKAVEAETLFERAEEEKNRKAHANKSVQVRKTTTVKKQQGELALGCIGVNALITFMTWQSFHSARGGFVSALCAFSFIGMIAIGILLVFARVINPLPKLVGFFSVTLTVLPWIGAWLVGH
jgi:tetratricopeptide (TPR) repeat protein